MNDASPSVGSRRFWFRLALAVSLLIVVAVSWATFFLQGDADVAFFLHAYRTDRIESSGDSARPQLAFINNSDRSVSITNVVIEVRSGQRWTEVARVGQLRPMGLAPKGRWMVESKLPAGHVTWRATARCQSSPGKAAQRLNLILFRLRVPFGFRGRMQTLVTQEYSF